MMHTTQSATRACQFCKDLVIGKDGYIRLFDGYACWDCATAKAREKSLVAEIERSGIELRPSGQSKYKAKCPFHSGHNRSSLSVWVKDGIEVYHCFVDHCDAGGDIVRFVMNRHKLAYPDAIRYILGDARCGPITPLPPAAKHEPEPPPPPLSHDLVDRYQLQLYNNPRPIEWWCEKLTGAWEQDRINTTRKLIDQYHLGYAPECRTYYDKDQPDYRSPSYTIPIYNPKGEVINIRHRVAKPLDPGDKYRPESRGRQAAIYNAPELLMYRNRMYVPRPDAKGCYPSEIVILEGEIKLMVWQRFFPFLPAITATAGSKSWIDRYAHVWPRLFNWPSLRRVYVILDPGAESVAEQTAMLFGRRGVPVYLPDKCDDLLLRYGDEAYQCIVDALLDASACRETSVFDMPALAYA